MAALDFPASPTLGQVYSANSRSWWWDGKSWQTQAALLWSAPGANDSVVRTFGGLQYWWNGTTWVYLPPDPYWLSVTILCPMATSSQANLFYYGTCQSSVSTSPSFLAAGTATGGNANLFGRPYGLQAVHGTGGYGSFSSAFSNAAWEFGTGLFTVEGWVFPTTITPGNTAYIFSNRANAGVSNFHEIGMSTAGQLNITTFAHSISGGAFVLGAWQHFAMTRDATNIYGFLSGASIGTPVADAQSVPTSNSMALVNTGYNYSTNFCFGGLLAWFRITKGVCRYTANFTPPATPFASY